jgi:hypothetical protein
MSRSFLNSGTLIVISHREISREGDLNLHILALYVYKLAEAWRGSGKHSFTGFCKETRHHFQSDWKL